MKSIYVSFEDEDWLKLAKQKKNKTWHEFILAGAECLKGKNKK